MWCDSRPTTSATAPASLSSALTSARLVAWARVGGAGVRGLRGVRASSSSNQRYGSKTTVAEGFQQRTPATADTGDRTAREAPSCATTISRESRRTTQRRRACGRQFLGGEHSPLQLGQCCLGHAAIGPPRSLRSGQRRTAQAAVPHRPTWNHPSIRRPPGCLRPLRCQRRQARWRH